MRKQRRLKVPTEVVELQYAYLPWIEDPHRILVEHPFSSVGANAALLLVDRPTKGTIMEHVAIVLPNDAPFTPQDNPVFVAALGLIRSELTRALGRVSGEPFIEILAESGWEAEPFSCRRLVALEMELDQITEKHARLGGPTSLLVVDVRRAIADFWTQKPGARLWSPLTAIRGGPFSKHADNWRLLESWSEWERRRLFQEDRADEFYGGAATGRQQQAFRVRLDRLHLKAPPKNSKSRVARREAARVGKPTSLPT